MHTLSVYTLTSENSVLVFYMTKDDAREVLVDYIIVIRWLDQEDQGGLSNLELSVFPPMSMRVIVGLYWEPFFLF